MPSEDDTLLNQSTRAFWDYTQFLWIILSIAAGLGIVYWIHRMYQTRQNRRMEQKRATERAQAIIPLQRMEPASPGRESVISIAAPRYEGHTEDVSVPENVKLEQRGKYSYLEKMERPPRYQG